jgi:STE24 endopeptidase
VLARQVHIFTAFYLFQFSLGESELYQSFGFSEKPTLIGLFLFFQTIWAPIDKVLNFATCLWSRHNEVSRRKQCPRGDSD